MTGHGESEGATQQQSLTAELLHLPATKQLYPRATQSRFLELAGKGKLPLHYLSQWLSQDRLYAEAYLRFIGGLTSLVELPRLIDHDDSKKSGGRGGGEEAARQKGTKRTSDTLEWRILELLRACLENILRELKFFEDTAAEYGIDLDSLGKGQEGIFGPNETTRGYIDLFDSFGSRLKATRERANGAAAEGEEQQTQTRSDGMLLLRGLVVLWTTEKVYLDAWLYAAAQGGGGKFSNDEGADDADGGALRKAFIPNWTSDEFVAFVEEIRGCLDEYARKEVEHEGQQAGKVSGVAKEVFEKVLRLEESFWPTVE